MSQTPPSYGFGRYGFGFFGRRIAFRATGAPWGRATPFFYHFSVRLSSVLGQRRTKSTRKRNTPENAGHRPFPQSAFSGVCVFGALCSPPENATHPKTQILGTVGYLRFRVCCVFGCFLAPANWGGQSSVMRSGLPGPQNPKSSAMKTTTWHCSSEFSLALTVFPEHLSRVIFDLLPCNWVLFCPTFLSQKGRLIRLTF